MKKFVLLFAMFLFTASLTACMSHIEDLNGDDTSLATINLDSSISSGSYSSTYSLTSSSYSGGRTYCFSYDDIDYDNINLTYSMISGVQKVSCSDMSEGDELSLTITSDLSEGNLEIAVVGPNNTLIQTVTANATTTVTIPSTAEGEYFVVVGAESAKFSMSIIRERN
ncbi:MAG: hypothetical protein PHP32_00470 [Candidatus Izemoplasmatales bacterium]|nr:hypothetical protein [Candidatus Izemoplasmatales bacterium]